MAQQGAKGTTGVTGVTGIGPRALMVPAREVPLGGLRSMNVQRALPQRALPTVGAWCFLDRFGPQHTTMRVEPHPHMGLQTVTWPLLGEVRHRDSLGNDVLLRAGQLNLMTAGAGIAHSEYSLGEGTAELDALQLWIALPEHARWDARGFERHEVLPAVTLPASEGADAEATVLMGRLAGVASPATTHSPLVGAQIRIAAASRVRIPLDPAWEHALVLLDGNLEALAVDDNDVAVRPGRNDLFYLGSDRDSVEVASQNGALVFLLGGEPFEEELVMWWNFVGRSHEEIVEARDEWEARSARFGTVDGHGDVRVPAPRMPTVRLTPRANRLGRPLP
jgi:redox-sensitive bicupin YhaK (pirin superfamily)